MTFARRIAGADGAGGGTVAAGGEGSAPCPPSLHPGALVGQLRRAAQVGEVPSGLRRVTMPVLATAGGLFLVYMASVVLPSHFHFSNAVNGWAPDVFELVVAAVCILRVKGANPGRSTAVLFGLGLMSWGLGDTVWTAQSVLHVPWMKEYLSPVLWLGFYPLAYAGLVQFVRAKLTTVSTPGWLDGAVASLGIAAVCAAFAFHGAASLSTAGAWRQATDLAYPIGDLMLLAIVVAATTLLSGAIGLPWLVLTAACLLNCAGDTFNLFSSSEGPSRIDVVTHALTWPAAGLLMTVALWLRSGAGRLSIRRPSGGLALPGAAAGAGLCVLVAATLCHVERVAVDLAVASLVFAGLRLAWSARGLQALTEQRHRQSMTDELTGLGNRRYLFELLDHYFEDQAAPGAPPCGLVFCFVDLNRFKEVNDSFGHLAGDELLKQLGPRFTACLGPSDVLVRLGGDEFGVVLLGADGQRAAAVATQLCAALEQPFLLEGVPVTVSASIGVAGVPGDATGVDRLLECADIAMYRAKVSHTSVAFFDEALDTSSHWRLGDELRQGIDERQFVLHYQPQLSLTDGSVVAVEALVRWQHPTLGLLPPSKFLALAENSGLMAPLTSLILDDALAQASAWRKAGSNLTLAVNVSAANLLDDGFVELVERLLARHAYPAEELVLEITETSVIGNFERAKLVIEGLTRLGLAVSIDDFGAGFTALSYLSSLAVGELKLDGRLVTGLADPGRERDCELVRSTIELGHTLGLRVVAEGVEDQATLELLRDVGADLAQGYVISRPQPAGMMPFPLAFGLDLAPLQRTGA